MDNIWLQSALWMALALIAALGSLWITISAALFEIIVGAIAGNTIGLPLTPWINYVASVGAVVLTFLAGTDIDAHVVRKNFGSSVTKARELHLAGATVLRGMMGFGHSSHIHTTKILRLSFDLPIVVEIVDTEQKITDFLPILDTMMASGLVTLEKVQVLQYGTEGLKENAPNWAAH
jgi:uncharacterized protein